MDQREKDQRELRVWQAEIRRIDARKARLDDERRHADDQINRLTARLSGEPRKKVSRGIKTGDDYEAH